jgi:hypothetical protein
MKRISPEQVALINSEPGRYGWRMDPNGLHVLAPSGVSAGTIGLDGLGSCHYAPGPQHKSGLGPFKSLADAGDIFTGKAKAKNEGR